MRIVWIPALLAALTAALLAGLSGCASTGTKIDDARLSELRKGQTTVAEVVKKFGRPNVLSKNWDGTQTAAYSKADGSGEDGGLLPAVGAVVLGGSAGSDTVVLYFDARGVLADYKATPAPMAAPSAATAPVSSPAAPAAGETMGAKGATAPAPARKRSDGLPSWMPSEVRDTRQ